MNVVVYSEKFKAKWDEFVATSKNSHFMYMRDYMEYHADRFLDHSLLVFDESNKLISLLPANLSNRTLYSHQGLSFGGIIISTKATTQLVYEVFLSVISYLKKNGKVDVFVYKRIPDFYCSYPSQEDLYALFRVSANLYRRDVSVAVALDNPLKFQKQRLRAIKKAVKNGVVVKEIIDFTDYWRVLENTLKSQHQASPVHSISEIHYLRSLFPNNIRCFVSVYKGNVVAGTVIFETEKVAHSQYISSSIEGRKVGALDVLFDKLINDIFLMKKFFDFGISTEKDGSFLNETLIAQKEGFGARAVVHDFYKIEI